MSNKAVNEMLPLPQLILLGLQHVLVLYVGSVAVPLVVGNAMGLPKADIAFLINASLICAGLATLVQTFGIGSKFGLRLPAMQGVTLMAAGALSAIGTQYDLPTIFGAVIVSGIICFIIGPFFGKLMPLFSPVVRGTVFTIVGLTLLPVAVNWIAGSPGSPAFGAPRNFLLALIVICVIVIVNKFFTGFLNNIAVLVGLVVGFIAAALLGNVSLSGLSEAAWLGFSVPFYFGMPKFEVVPILSLTTVMLVIMAETIVMYLALGEMTGSVMDEQKMASGFRANGLNVVLSGILNSFVFTTFTQNLGLVALTGVKSRYTAAAGGIILVILGLVPKLATIVASIPTPVLGGAGLVVFATITASGIKTLLSADLNNQKNMLIVALSIGIGLCSALFKGNQAFAEFSSTARIFLEDGVITGCLAAIILNLIFAGRNKADQSGAVAPGGTTD